MVHRRSTPWKSVCTDPNVANRHAVRSYDGAVRLSAPLQLDRCWPKALIGSGNSGTGVTARVHPFHGFGHKNGNEVQLVRICCRHGDQVAASALRYQTSHDQQHRVRERNGLWCAVDLRGFWEGAAKTGAPMFFAALMYLISGTSAERTEREEIVGGMWLAILNWTIIGKKKTNILKHMITKHNNIQNIATTHTLCQHDIENKRINVKHN